jgi:hypothetical protein
MGCRMAARFLCPFKADEYPPEYLVRGMTSLLLCQYAFDVNIWQKKIKFIQ